MRVARKQKRHGASPSRDTKRGAYRERSERFDRLFYEASEDEWNIGHAGPKSMAARAVLIDVLHEIGSPRTAEALRRLGRGKLSGTLLEQKIRRTIFGPVPSGPGSRYWPRKPKKSIWLARVGERDRATRWIPLEDKDVAREGGDPYLFEIGIGYSSLYKLVYADGAEEALEGAESRWSHLFLDELDEEEAAEVEERGEDVFPHPTKRGVQVRRSDDVYMVPPTGARALGSYPGSGRGGPFVRAVLRARIVDADRRLAAITSPFTEGFARFTVVEYER